MKKNNNWVYLLLNAWAVLSIVILMLIVLYCSIEKPTPVNFWMVFIFGGVIVSCIMCVINFFRALPEPKQYKFNTINSDLPDAGYQPIDEPDINNPPQDDDKSKEK